MNTLISSTLPKFASNDRKKGTVEEYSTVGQWSNALYETYKVLSEKERAVRMNVDGCSFPNGMANIRIGLCQSSEMR